MMPDTEYALPAGVHSESVDRKRLGPTSETVNKHGAPPLSQPDPAALHAALAEGCRGAGVFLVRAIPELTTATLLALGLVGMAAGRRRTAARPN